jgi:hypothetical protein
VSCLPAPRHLTGRHRLHGSTTVTFIAAWMRHHERTTHPERGTPRLAVRHWQAPFHPLETLGDIASLCLSRPLAYQRRSALSSRVGPLSVGAADSSDVLAATRQTRRTMALHERLWSRCKTPPAWLSQDQAGQGSLCTRANAHTASSRRPHETSRPLVSLPTCSTSRRGTRRHIPCHWRNWGCTRPVKWL